LGWERGFTVETGKTQSREKSPNNAARTPSRLHAVLGGYYVVVRWLAGFTKRTSRGKLGVRMQSSQISPAKTGI